jgi:hypothetical protein
MRLTYGTLRYHLHRQLLLAAQVGAQIGIVSDQVVALRDGLPVQVTSAQLRMFGAYPSKSPARQRWTLRPRGCSPGPTR